MKYFYLVFAFIFFITGCRKSEANYQDLSEDQLKEVLKSDKLFNKYVDAFVTWREVVANSSQQKNISALVKSDIKEGKVKNLSDYKKSYISHGGDPQFINAFNNVVYLQGKLKKKYKDLIRTKPQMFSRVVSESIPKFVPDKEKVKQRVMEDYMRK